MLVSGPDQGIILGRLGFSAHEQPVKAFQRLASFIFIFLIKSWSFERYGHDANVLAHSGWQMSVRCVVLFGKFASGTVAGMRLSFPLLPPSPWLYLARPCGCIKVRRGGCRAVVCVAGILSVNYYFTEFSTNSRSSYCLACIPDTLRL